MRGRAVNPFLGGPASQPVVSPAEATVGDPLLGGREFVAGPATPPMVPPVAEPVLGRRHVAGAPVCWIVGCHGGAGATSLVHALGPEAASESERAWPVTPSAATSSPRVVLVARTHHSGLKAGLNAAREWASGEVSWITLVGVVLIADGPQLAPSCHPLIEQLLHATHHGWFLPWIEQWRGLPVTQRPVGRRESRTLTSIVSRSRES